VELDRNGLEVLGRDECLRLLADRAFGRIALTSGALPVVLPVNYAMAGESVILKTGRGTKLDAATRNAVVAFEVDQVDEQARAGWSVLVTGVAEEVTDPKEIERLQRLPLDRWAPGEDGRFVRISTEIVSGRRLGPPLLGPPFNGNSP
jgi:nitroimidazol reductase NimA-like FMN-containing flavoprotein (pyridoxamine 5'-phosphate oxidase superfamily)